MKICQALVGNRVEPCGKAAVYLVGQEPSCRAHLSQVVDRFLEFSPAVALVAVKPNRDNAT